jgi:ABC-2 type transport system permease protein
MLKKIIAQIQFEFVSAAKNVEQQLISLIIPIGILVGGNALGEIDNLLPLALGVSVLGSNLTGPAIGMAFDRRYGSIKGWAFTPIGSGGYLAGRLGALSIFALVQALLLSTIEFVQVGRIELNYLALPGIFALQVLAGSLAVTIASKLRAEAVLASANLALILLASTAALVNTGFASFLHPLSAWIAVTAGSLPHLFSLMALAGVAYVTAVRSFKWD